MSDKFAAVTLDDDYALRLLTDLVNIPSVFPEEESVMLFIEEELGRLRLPTRRIPIGDGRFNLLAGIGSGSPVFCLNAHSDTVPPSGNSVPQARIADGRMYGLGSVDDKACVAAMISVMKGIAESGVTLNGTLDLLISVDEEGDARGVRTAVEEAGYVCDYAVVGEASNLEVVPAHSGIIFLDIVTHGRSTHGSMPMEGINAIELMCELVSGLRTAVTNYPDHPLIGPPTLNLGILSGGDRPNRVPDRCEASVDIRLVPPMTVEKILSLIDDYFAEWKGRAEYVLSKQGDPLNTPLDCKLISALQSVSAEVCGSPSPIVGWRGWTEAEPFQSKLGADAIVCGPGSLLQAHSGNEFVDLEQFRLAARIYSKTALSFL